MPAALGSCQGSSPVRRSGMPGGRVSATVRAPIQSGRECTSSNTAMSALLPRSGRDLSIDRADVAPGRPLDDGPAARRDDGSPPRAEDPLVRERLQGGHDPPDLTL